MKRSRIDGIGHVLVAAAVLSALLGCTDDVHRQFRELTEVERALSLLRNAPRDERGIRLEQLMAVEVDSPSVQRVKDICAQSHNEMTSAMRALDEARQQTTAAEGAVESAKKAMRAEQREITAEEMAKLLSMSKGAAETLVRVTENLDRAEELVESCSREREDLRRALTGGL